jgi:O-antigen/teichoic acid export membrane protein
MPEVAASEHRSESALLTGKIFRLTLYAHALVLIPLWFAAPYILRLVYGAEFVAATSALRLLLLASIVWSAAMIVISGLNGLGHPGLSTIARLCSSAITIVTLFWLLPIWGMNGAAVSSLLGYGTMLAVALVCLTHKQQISLWEFVCPRREDISLAKIKSFFKFELRIPQNSES